VHYEKHCCNAISIQVEFHAWLDNGMKLRMGRVGCVGTPRDQLSIE
jgi:hypothetical protein